MSLLQNLKPQIISKFLNNKDLIRYHYNNNGRSIYINNYNLFFRIIENEKLPQESKV